MVNIFINDYPKKDTNNNDEIVTVLNDNIQLDVSLVEQVEKLTKANSLLVQHMSSIEDDNRELKELVSNSYKMVDELLTELNIVKDYIKNDLTTILTPKDTKKESKETITRALKNLNKQSSNSKTKTGRQVKDTDIYVPNKSLRVEWKYLELRDDGTIVNKSKRVFKLPVDLNLLLYIMECDKTPMDRATAKLLMSKYKLEYQFFGKLIYNIRETNSFDNVLKKYNNNLAKARFSIKNNMLCVNKINTNIPISTAKEWIHILSNTTFKQKKILDFQKANPDIDKNMIRIVCDSYNNNQLFSLLKNVKKDTFVENNPSKRRNLIKNGGLL